MSLYRGRFYLKIWKHSSYKPIVVSAITKEGTAYPVDVFIRCQPISQLKYLSASLPSVHADIFQTRHAVRDNNLYFLNY